MVTPVLVSWSGGKDSSAAALGLPLRIVGIPPAASDQDYEARMEAALAVYSSRGISTVAFGAPFLSDIKAYREAWLSRIGLRAIFPIWHEDTWALADTFVAEGFAAVVTCIDSQVLFRPFAGRLFDQAFLRDLPPSVDRCGENGEFHTFVFAGPLFQGTVEFVIGEIVQRERWYFCDLVAT